MRNDVHRIANRRLDPAVGNVGFRAPRRLNDTFDARWASWQVCFLLPMTRDNSATRVSTRAGIEEAYGMAVIDRVILDK
jgi:hypothetical protein